VSLSDNPYSLDTDYQTATADFVATSGRVGLAPLSNQAGRACLFKNSSGQFSLAQVDGNGNQLVSPVSPTGGSLNVYTGQTTPISSSQFGALAMGRQTINSTVTYQPLAIDSQGALIVAGGPKPSFRCIVKGVTCGTNVVLVSIINGGSNYLRLANINVYVPSLGTVAVNGGSIIGITGTTTTTTYYPLFCELYRITSHAKGTSTTTLSPVPCDSSDTLDPAITVYSLSTISASTGLLHRRDALQCTNTGVEYYRTICSTEKNITCRPGEGIALVCVSNGNVPANNSNGYATASVDVGVTFTQAVA
jgi:hypothetical protein